MTIDAVRAGFRVEEVPVAGSHASRHRPERSVDSPIGAVKGCHIARAATARAVRLR